MYSDIRNTAGMPGGTTPRFLEEVTDPVRVRALTTRFTAATEQHLILFPD